MRLTVVLTLACLTSVAVGAQETTAQDADDSTRRRPPIFLAQPGMLSANFLSAPGEAASTTGFNLRFATLIPTRSPWWTIIVGASVTPYGTSGFETRDQNTPVLFAGNVFPLVRPDLTDGWISLDLPILLTYAYGGGGPRNRALYGKDFVAQLAVNAYVGRKVLNDLGPLFSRLRVYFLLDQLLTPNEDRLTGQTDRFNPIAQYGISIPIGTRRDDP